jgi:hypothetical protein
MVYILRKVKSPQYQDNRTNNGRTAQPVHDFAAMEETKADISKSRKVRSAKNAALETGNIDPHSPPPGHTLG